jgi:hypothetical protein
MRLRIGVVQSMGAHGLNPASGSLSIYNTIGSGSPDGMPDRSTACPMLDLLWLCIYEWKWTKFTSVCESSHSNCKNFKFTIAIRKLKECDKISNGSISYVFEQFIHFGLLAFMQNQFVSAYLFVPITFLGRILAYIF